MKGANGPFYSLWNGRSVLRGQHQTALHNPDLDGCVDLEPGLVQPVKRKTWTVII